jgi:hypothetical protein
MRIWLALFIAGLVLSGVTAFPLKRELSMILGILGDLGAPRESRLVTWLHTVRDALAVTDRHYPFLA